MWRTANAAPFSKVSVTRRLPCIQTRIERLAEAD